MIVIGKGIKQDVVQFFRYLQQYSPTKKVIMYFLTKVFSFLCLSSLVLTQIPRSRIYHGGFGEGNYSFGYRVSEPSGAIKFRQEAGDSNGNRQGSYGLSESDRTRIVVNYSTKPRSTVYHENHPTRSIGTLESHISEGGENSQWIDHRQVPKMYGKTTTNSDDDDQYDGSYEDNMESDRSGVPEMMPKHAAVWGRSWEKRTNEHNHRHQEHNHEGRDLTPSEIDRASYDRLVKYVTKSKNRNY